MGRTDTGIVRDINQDSYASGELPGNAAWAVVCDGMGGVNGGEVASEMAVKFISEQITKCGSFQRSNAFMKDLLVTAVKNANSNIYNMSKSNMTLRGMGTTVVAVIVYDGFAHIAHVGDSRAYKINENGIEQLTRDHSLVQELIERGKLTLEEAANHPHKNLITRALGVSSTVAVDYCSSMITDSDTLLICTDGLPNYVDENDIFAAVQDGGIYDLADKLVNMANDNGGGDNTTVVVIKTR